MITKLRVLSVLSATILCAVIAIDAPASAAQMSAAATAADDPAPNAPVNLTKGGGFINNAVSLRWDAPVGGTSPAGYNVYVLDGATFRLAVSSAVTSAQVTGLVAFDYYVFYVVAVNSAGVAGPPSNLWTDRAEEEPPSPRSPPPGSDIAEPRPPSDLRVCGDDENAVNMCWGAASDDVGVTGYDVFRADGGSWVLTATTTGTRFTDTGLTDGSTFTYAVVAKDAAGKLSDPSLELVAVAGHGTPSISCAYRYSAVVWDTGAAGNVRITNTGTVAIAGWTVRIRLSNGLVMTPPGWGATWSQLGDVATAVAPPWNTTIAAGKSIRLGFIATHHRIPPPSIISVTLNGEPCTATPATRTES